MGLLTVSVSVLLLLLLLSASVEQGGLAVAR